MNTGKPAKPLRTPAPGAPHFAPIPESDMLGLKSPEADADTMRRQICELQERVESLSKYNGGSMDIAAGEKTIRLIELCDTFHLPLVYFADEPGFSVGRAEEELGIVRAGARVVTTHTQSKTPFVCFVLRQLYGVAGGLQQRGGNALYRRYCWPSTHGGSMHIEGGTAIAYKRDIENAPDPEARRQEIEARLQAISSPFRNAHAFGIEEIIDPRDTRPLLVDFIDDAWKVVQTQLGPGSGPSYRP